MLHLLPSVLLELRLQSHGDISPATFTLLGNILTTRKHSTLVGVQFFSESLGEVLAMDGGADFLHKIHRSGKVAGIYVDMD